MSHTRENIACAKCVRYGVYRVRLRLQNNLAQLEGATKRTSRGRTSPPEILILHVSKFQKQKKRAKESVRPDLPSRDPRDAQASTLALLPNQSLLVRPSVGPEVGRK